MNNTIGGEDRKQRSVTARDTGTPEPATGVDLARRALEQARSAGGPRRAQVRRPVVGRGGGRGRRRGWSGPGADGRDPQLLGAAAADLVRRRGWSEQISAATVLGRWAGLVGPEIADHATPVSLTDRVLVLAAESTAWATQLRYLRREMLGMIAAGVGPGVVTEITVTGPSRPSWRFGERHVRGRGPRDTYG